MRNVRGLERLMYLLAIIVIGSRVGDVTLLADDAPDPQRSSAALIKMQGEMSKIKFAVIREKGKELWAELKSEPILRYTDPQRAFPDAGLWIWTIDGLPVGFSKLERLGNATAPSWQYCLSVVNDDQVAVRWTEGITWKSREAAFKFRGTNDKDIPQKTAALRLAQLRNIANRFRATTYVRGADREEMRLLAQPIHRYANSELSVVDGAVFGLVSNGTNPDALLLVQVRLAGKDRQPVWEYGCLGMTGDEVVFELDDKKAFDHKGALTPGDYGHWVWLVLRE